MAIEIKLWLLILGLVSLVIIYDIIKTNRLIALGVQQTNNTQAFERRLNSAQLKFLVIGDSSAVGVGAIPPEGSIAGRLASDFPEADIQNLAVSGSKVADAIKQLESLTEENNFDMILIQIGGNDIVRRTPYAEIEKNLPKLFNLAQQRSANIVQLTSGNVGTSQLLPFGTRWYFTYRTKQVRQIFMRIAAEHNVHYIDLYRKRADDPYASDPNKYYSLDFFHPSAEGYGDWYSFVRPVVKNLPDLHH